MTTSSTGTSVAGRRRDAAATRAAILQAARDQFGASGFERTTIRSVASVAGVDPALVMRYYGNKAGLFGAVVGGSIVLPDLRSADPTRAAEALVPAFFAAWAPDGPLLPMLRAAASSETAADALRTAFAERVQPLLESVAVDDPRERAVLVAALMLGVAVGRHVVGLPVLREMSQERLAAMLVPTVAGVLSGAV